jgi:hypothetical protein
VAGYFRVLHGWSSAINSVGCRAAAELVGGDCWRAREREIDIVRSAVCIDEDDKRMAIRRTADIGAKRPLTYG